MLKRILYLNVLMASVLSMQCAAQENVSVSKTDMSGVFQKMNAWFRNTPAYSLSITHASFENHLTQTPAEKATGYFKKDKENYHSFLIGIHTIQNSNYKIVIDTAEKIILVANPDQLAWTSYTPDDYSALLKDCRTIKVIQKGTDKLYRIELPEHLPVSAYEFLVNAEGLPREITWYYSKEVQKEGNDPVKVKPRVSISFSGYKKNVAFSYKEEFSEEPYFINKNKKLFASAKFSGFKLSDQRIRN